MRIELIDVELSPPPSLCDCWSGATRAAKDALAFCVSLERRRKSSRLTVFTSSDGVLHFEMAGERTCTVATRSMDSRFAGARTPSLQKINRIVLLLGIREFHRSKMIWYYNRHTAKFCVFIDAGFYLCRRRFSCDHVFLMNMLPGMLKSMGFTIYTSDVKEITAGRFSAVLQYLHTVKLQVVQRGVAVCTLEATCGSAAACPAWVPMSLLLSIPLSCLPFPDCGSNESILRRIKERGTNCKCISFEIPTSLIFFVVFIMGPAVIFVTVLNLSGVARM
eukprot:jgi/Bigna1/66168/fgenesh1_pg.1_\